MNRLLVTGWLVFLCAVSACAATDYAATIATLIEPVKLATLAPRGANPRVQKCVYWLASAQAAGAKPEWVLDKAAAKAGYRDEAAKMTKEALLRNLDIARKLGCLDQAGMSELRQGQAATIRRGPYIGDQLSVDHVIPRAVCPELDNVIANLELMPQRMNSSKRDQIGERQMSHARRLRKAGLLSAAGLRAVEAARSTRPR